MHLHGQREEIHGAAKDTEELLRRPHGEIPLSGALLSSGEWTNVANMMNWTRESLIGAVAFRVDAMIIQLKSYWRTIS